MKKTACFFVKGVAPSAMDRIEFYAQDIQCLRDAGYDIRFASRIRDLRPASLIYVWWWTWALIPVVFARLLGRPVMVTGVLDINYYVERPWWHRLLMRMAFAGAHMNVFTSRMEYDDLPERFFVRRPAFVPLSVDTEQYRPAGSRDENLVCNVQWLQFPNVERKCLVEVIEAAVIVHRTYPDVQFVIPGAHGNYAGEAAALVDARGASSYISFPGAISREDKIALMQRCAVYLQPTRYEGFGLAILEAMSCGAPILTSAAGAVPEVAGDAALFVDGTKPDEIARELCRYLADRTLRNEMGNAARTRALAQFPYSRRRHDMAALLAQVTS